MSKRGMKFFIGALLIVLSQVFEGGSYTPLHAESVAIEIESTTGSSASIEAIPTFHSIGLVWNPSDASSDSEASVRFRVGSDAWRDGHPLWYAGDGEYRGSLVELTAGTSYEIELSNGSQTDRVTVATWSEAFPISETVFVQNTDEPLTITESGSAGGYVLYTPALGTEGVLDVQDRSNFNIRVDAHHVIIRGFTLRNAAMNAIELEEDAHDVIIEKNDISGWGRIDERDGWGVNQDSAIFSSQEEVERIIVQRNRIHHPRSDANNWSEESYSTYGGRIHHPEGAQAIYFGNSRGNHVIRYNEIYSDEDHKFNDCIGGGANGGPGFPGHNSDIYGNIVQDCWDDALEIEGYNQNVRIWGNYTNRTYMHIATRPTQEGPLYIWRNVADASRKEHVPSEWDDDNRGHFIKSGNLNDMGGGRVYVYHNTMLQNAGEPELNLEKSIGSAKGLSGAMRNYVSRNNIFYVVRGGDSIHQEKSHDSNDFDFDLFNGDLEKVAGHEQNGFHGLPEFANSVSAANVSETRTATLSLRPSSLGYDSGAYIPNFNDLHTGSGPDIGAHEDGTSPMRFGIAADFMPEQPEPEQPEPEQPAPDPSLPEPVPTPTTPIPPIDTELSDWLYLPLVQR